MLLSDYFTGHLSDKAEKRVEDHLGECRSCRLNLRTMVLIAGRARDPGPSVEARHYSPQLLGRYFTDPNSLDKKLIQQIESHLQSCTECARDIEFLKNSDLDLRELVNTHRRKGFLKNVWENVKDFFSRH
jgi:predicted anti-sigma-YlaC factor YlaD